MIAKKTLLFFAVTGILGFTVYNYKDGILTTLHTLTSNVQPSLTTLQNAWSQVQSTWASIPEAFRGLIVAGIPTLFMLFFAWTKNRAMQQLQHTQQQAKAQFNQLQGEKLEAKTQAETRIAQLEQQLATRQSGDLSASLSEAQQMVALQNQEIQKITTERNQLQTLLEQLKMKTVTVKEVK